ncbi:MAG: hypothetical protein K2K46_07440 [Lachnospiraceae bacterium]|nr:hypothetical protein [Lachnospiraceae bacterium]
MDNYQNAALGLKQVFSGKLWLTICETLSPIVFLASWFFLGDGGFFFMYIFYFGRILFPAICVAGLYRTGKDIGTCKIAAVLCFADVVALVLKYILQSDGLDDFTYVMSIAALGINMYDKYLEGVAAWIDITAGIVHYVAPVLIMYFVCTSVAAVMKELAKDEISKFGRKVLIINLITGICYTIDSFLPLPILTDLIKLANFVAAIFYLRFLYRSYQALDT